MPSFDVVCKLDLQEVDNAINQAAREISQRFDFKNTGASVARSGNESISISANADERALAVVEVLNAIYETDFLGFSYGFRRGRSQHHALDALATGITRKKVNWVLDADIRSFFDTIDHGWMVKFVEHRIADTRMVRLIQKWLAAGVLEHEEWSATEEGVPQQMASGEGVSGQWRSSVGVVHSKQAMPSPWSRTVTPS